MGEENGGHHNLPSLCNTFHNSMLQAKREVEQLEHFFSKKLYPAFAHESEFARSEFQRVYQESQQNWMKEREGLLQERHIRLQEKHWEQDRNERERQSLREEVELLKMQYASLLQHKGGPLGSNQLTNVNAQDWHSKDAGVGVASSSSPSSDGFWEHRSMPLQEKESFVSVSGDESESDDDHAFGEFMKPVDHAPAKLWETPFNSHQKSGSPFGNDYDEPWSNKAFDGNLGNYHRHSKNHIPPARVLKSRLKLGAGGYGKFGIWS